MDIIELSGVGAKTAKLLNKLDIYNVEDLLTYYPYKYNVFSFSPLVQREEAICISAIIESMPVVYYIRKNFNKLSFRVRASGIMCNAVIFNRAFLKPNLRIGKEIVLIGKYDSKKNLFTASEIKFNIKNGDIEPIYHLTSGITSSSIHKFIKSSLSATITDNLPSDIISNYHFLDKKTALKKIHFPVNATDIKQAKIRLIYEELFDFSFKMNFLNKRNQGGKGLPHSFNKQDIDLLISSLPFKLTEDQQNSLDEILDDMKSSKRMNRILLGDVGSGKTIISAISSYASFLSGYQTALMAPTEILAIQHYNSIKKILEPFNVTVDVITGSMTTTEKNAIYKRLANHEIDLLIGTHAILNDSTIFAKLGLVITDEQHRFGVNQRNILQNKSEAPDVLYLSATPIPRTYALTIYGDLDISMIKSKPFGRKEIITKVKTEKEIKDVLSAMLEEIKKGHQVYIVSPLVEQNEELDLRSVDYLKEKIDLAFNNQIRSEVVHGKMKQANKDAIMNDFKLNKIKILISTTVIEVGIDVPNATMIVIFNAERFGLASLHQLRGRVGRSEIQSYCYLISNSDNERLRVMEESNDGFYISQKDFEMRGHGDLFGTRQSGDMKFKLANLKNDYKILVQAKNDSQKFIETQEYLTNPYYKGISTDLDIAD